MEKQISSKEIYNGKVIKVYKDEVDIDGVQKSFREIVKHNGGACIALKDDNRYFMVKQYRYAHKKYMYEFPAGKIEIGEKPLESIKREVVEETGYQVKNIKSMGQMIPTCGYSSEIIYLYYGLKGEYVGQHLDKDENLNLYLFTYKEIEEMIKKGTIDDGKTIALMYRLLLAGIE